MKPIQLYNGYLHSALAPTLESAAARYVAATAPTPQWYSLHELAEQRPYFAPEQPVHDLLEHLTTLVQQCLQGLRAPYDDMLLVIASTTLDISQIETLTRAAGQISPQLFSPLDHLAQALRQRLHIAHAFTLNTACTSAANALLYAARMINAGLYERALVLAFETPSQITAQGFAALGLISPTAQYRPFHPHRDGLVLGEAYSAVMLGQHAETPAFAQLLGGASACDSSNLTTTAEDGSHIAQVMQDALDSAALQPEQIGLIKLHGTATHANDHAESQGVQRLFGAQLPPCCVLKPYLGHTLGACGLSEPLLLQQAIAQGALPPSRYANEAILPLAAEPLQLPQESYVLYNFFGFGGNNASLVLQGLPQ